MYSDPYCYDNGYGDTGRSCARWHGHCPICGATGECPDTVLVAMPYPPFTLDGQPEPSGGPLRRYRVTVGGYDTVMQLNDTDAARYGDAAALIG